MKVRTTEDEITTDTAGKTVAPVLVREVEGNVTGADGFPIAPVSVDEDENGVPVRIVETATALDTAGNRVTALPVTYQE